MYDTPRRDRRRVRPAASAAGRPTPSLPPPATDPLPTARTPGPRGGRRPARRAVPCRGGRGRAHNPPGPAAGPRRALALLHQQAAQVPTAARLGPPGPDFAGDSKMLFEVADSAVGCPQILIGQPQGAERAALALPVPDRTQHGQPRRKVTDDTARLPRRHQQLAPSVTVIIHALQPCCATLRIGAGMCIPRKELGDDY